MTNKNNYILFFGTDWPSNFAPTTIVELDPFWEETIYDSNHPIVTFKTAEAYYQSRKAVMVGDKCNYYKIAHTKDPAETKKIARHIKLNPKEWDQVRVYYMWKTLQLKFEQNPDMLKKLLDPSIDGKEFVEASPYDCFWGVGMSEHALVREIEEFGRIERLNYTQDISAPKNVLGRLLNKLRNHLIIKNKLI